jgi:hypothetical protein
MAGNMGIVMEPVMTIEIESSAISATNMENHHPKNTCQ